MSSLLRPFHELQLAQAIYAELLRPRPGARASRRRDYWWVSEGLSRVLADRFIERARPGRAACRTGSSLFNVFAIVDRFESAPKIPFVDAFFERARSDDPLHARVTTFNTDLPPGRVILGKLRQVVGDGAFDALVDRSASAPGCRFGAALGDAAATSPGSLDQWCDRTRRSTIDSARST